MASFSVTEQAAADIDDILERTLERWGERKYWEYSDLIEQAALSSRKTRRAVARLLPRLNPGSSDTTSSNRGVTRDTSCSTRTIRRTIA